MFLNLLNGNIMKHHSKLPRKSMKFSKTPSQANLS